MLTFEENGWNFKAVKILSSLNLLPIQVDMVNGKIERQSSKTRIFLWRTQFCLGISHCFYMLLTLVQSTILEPEKYFRWDHFIIHFTYVVVYSLLNFVGFCMFVQNPDECEVIFNQLFVEREDPVKKMIREQLEERTIKITLIQETSFGGKSGPLNVVESSSLQNPVQSPKSSQVRPLLTWPPQYSLDELLARLLSFPLVIALFFCLLILAIDPSRPQLVYSILPPEWQNLSSFLALFSIEVLSIAVIDVFVFFSILTEVLFFGKCQLELKRMNLQLRTFVEKFQSRSLEIGVGGREIRREIWILRQILSEMRELQLFIELFNRCFPFCIFALKILCLVVSSFFYFFAVRHSDHFRLLGLFSGYCAVVCTLVYGILYQKAFSIPGKIGQVKAALLLAAQRTQSKWAPPLPSSKSNKTVWAEMKRETRRIRAVGVKVGNFHTLERESTPNFIDFVLRNVVNLLVTFSK